MRHTRFGLACLSSLIMVFSATPLRAEPKNPEKNGLHMEHGGVMTHCAKTCSDCQRMCDQCAAHCANLLREGKMEHFATLASCQDCADVCVAASKIISRSGPAAKQICQSCAEVCTLCAQNCEKFPEDKHMKACAEECRKCEKSCREMIKHLGE